MSSSSSNLPVPSAGEALQHNPAPSPAVVSRVLAQEEEAASGCSHCGLPVPPARRAAADELQFCCDGCATVYSVIHDQGLDQYYDIRERIGAAGRRVKTVPGAYEHFDDPVFHELHCRAQSEGLSSVEFYLEGVHCSACLWLVERAAMLWEGVRSVRLDLTRSVAHIVFDPAAIRLSEIARHLDSLGYPPHPHRGMDRHQRRLGEDRKLLGRIAVAGAAAGNVMLAAAALYGGEATGITRDYEQFFRWVSWVVSTPAILWSASVFYRGAWASVRTRTPHMDLPIAIGISAGYLWGAYLTLRGFGDIYFDSVTTLVFLLLLGRWLQRKQQRAAADASELLSSLAPSTARLVSSDGDESTKLVPVEALVPGQLVEVRSGEPIPVDGLVIEGTSSLDSSLLTGESWPLRVQVDSMVHAGCVNLTSRIRLRVTASGEATRVGKLVQEMEAASRRQAPVVRLADRLSARFVVVVLGLALITLVVWGIIDPSHAIDHTVALLVVSCPCALGLATPLAVSASLGKAAQAGILVKGGDALEQLAQPGLIVFDKTGTLTEGKLALTSWVGDSSVKPLVAAVEAHSAHPLARAFLLALPESSAVVSEVVERLGAGLTAQVEGHQLQVGSVGFAEASGQALPDWANQATQEASQRAESPVVVLVDGEVKAVAAFGDPVRSDAARSLKRLSALGYQLAVLSGDHPEVVRAVVKQLDVPFDTVRGGASPEEKLAFVEARRKEGLVVMVGDGANDAAALAAAQVGVAVHGGAEASLAAADVFTTASGITPVVELVEGARRVLRVIHRNIAFSLLYNLVGVSLAMTGMLSPLIAALLMPVSSLTVITSSFRSRTFGNSSTKRREIS